MTAPIRALIVDDERLARRDLRSLLNVHPEIEVVGEADSVSAAAAAIDSLDPNLLFLDIQMPGESGFDLLEKHDIRARVIFVTAFDEHAIHAFEVEALDYLLKPVNPDRLRKAIERIGKGPAPDAAGQRPLQHDDTLFITINSRLKFVRVSSIICIQAAADYSEIVLADGKRGLTQKSLLEWETRLPASRFCRIHRGTIINLDHVIRIEEVTPSVYRVILQHLEQPVAMSRRHATRLKELLG